MKKLFLIASLIMTTFCFTQTIEFHMNDYTKFYAFTTDYDSLSVGNTVFDQEIKTGEDNYYVLADDKKTMDFFSSNFLISTKEVINYNETDNLIKITINDFDSDGDLDICTWLDFETKTYLDFYLVYNKDDATFMMYYVSPIISNVVVGYRALL